MENKTSEIEEIISTVLYALACPLVLPLLLIDKEKY